MHTHDAKIPSWRATFSLSLLALLACIVVVRAFVVQVVNSDSYVKKGEARYLRTIDGNAIRGDLLDSHGTLLATSVPVKNLFVIPEDAIYSSEQIVEEVLGPLNIPLSRYEELMDKHRTKRFLLMRNIPFGTADRISVVAPGFVFDTSFLRQMSRPVELDFLLGVDSADRLTPAGLESVFDRELRGNEFRQEHIRDRRGDVVEIREISGVREKKTAVHVTVDLRSQLIVHTLLEELVQATGASSGSAVVVDAASGGVMALTGVANMSNTSVDDKHSLHPSVVEFEPGPLIKPTILSMLVDASTSRGTQMRHASLGEILGIPEESVSGRPGTQVEWRTDALAKAILRMPPKEVHSALLSMGYGRKVEAFRSASASGRIFSPDRWSVDDHASVAMGYGLRVTPMQLLQAYLPLLNQGRASEITLRQESGAVKTQRIRMETAALVKRSLERNAIPAVRAACSEGGWSALQTVRKTGMSKGEFIARYQDIAIGWCNAGQGTLLTALMLEGPQTSSRRRQDALTFPVRVAKKIE